MAYPDDGTVQTWLDALHGLDLLPAGLRRPAPGDSIQEIVIPLDEYAAPWLPKAVQATADRLKADPRRRRR